MGCLKRQRSNNRKRKLVHPIQVRNAYLGDPCAFDAGSASGGSAGQYFHVEGLREKRIAPSRTARASGVARRSSTVTVLLTGHDPGAPDSRLDFMRR